MLELNFEKADGLGNSLWTTLNIAKIKKAIITQKLRIKYKTRMIKCIDFKTLLT